jgi:hypothetical protein
MREFTIKDIDSSAYLKLSRKSADGAIEIDLQDHGLMLHADAYPFMAESLPTFLLELAGSWRGWDGVKTWGTLEGELSLSFSHNKVGYVFVKVEVRHPTQQRWRCQTGFTLEPASLDTLAAQSSGLFVKEEGA